MVSSTREKLTPRVAIATAPARYTSFWTAGLLVTDIIMFVLAAYIAGALVAHDWSLHDAIIRLLHSSLIFIAVWICMFYFLGLYRRSLALSFKDEFYFTVIALLFGVVPQLVVFTILPSLSTSRLVLLLSAVIAIGLVGTSRSMTHLLRVTVRKRYPSRILIIGDAARVKGVVDDLARDDGETFTACTLYTNFRSPGEPEAAADVGLWFDTAVHRGCEQVIVTDLKASQHIGKFLMLCEGSGIKVTLALPSMHIGAYGLEIERKGSQDLLVPLRPAITRPTSRLIKRIFDIAFALILGLLILPLMVVAGLAVWAESGMPIFFQQERVGRLGRTFKIVKFRTMRTDADSAWAKPRDERITRVGALLRRTSIDELPQLWNVLKGNMSLVGPRPEMRAFEDRFAITIPLYVERRLALPGMTGWAQVNMKRNLSPDDVGQVLDHDLFYIRHWSVFLDFTVVLKTAAEFLFHRAV